MNASVRNNVLDLIKNKNKLDEDSAKDLEKGIYNWCIQYAKDHYIAKTWDNPIFFNLYREKSRSVITNLDPTSYVQNTRLLQRLQNKEFLPHDIPFMDPPSLNPELWREVVDLKTKRDENFMDKETPMTSEFRCGRCKSRECVYREMQTRSADESSTIFVRCLNCNNSWKIS